MQKTMHSLSEHFIGLLYMYTIFGKNPKAFFRTSKSVEQKYYQLQKSALVSFVFLETKCSWLEPTMHLANLSGGTFRGSGVKYCTFLKEN